MKQNNLRSLLFILPLIAANTLLAQQPNPKNDKVYLDEKMSMVRNEKQAAFYRLAESAADGMWQAKAYFLDGQLKMEGTYKDQELTIPHGTFKYYYSNGKLESSGVYIDGVKSGIWRRFDENGREKAEKVYGTNYQTFTSG